MARRKVLSKAKVYLVLDADVCPYSRLQEALRLAVKAGVKIIQLRDKRGSAGKIMAFAGKTRRYWKGRSLFIVNDRVDVALACGADGVHLGRDDIPLGEARKLAGPRLIIGASCQTLAHLRQAQQEGADYIGFGSVFRTRTKPQRRPMDLALLASAAKAARIPLFAIGGITPANAVKVVEAGASRIAVTRSILLARDVGRTIKELHAVLKGR